ncbi:hypothetical protein GCM10007972_25800 [Iodidimonas muriae]|uniref:Lipopolysaccharide export system permease protein LptF n=1 Tax=Iodidimonas muriae TaxID=261467 RepID=A0ABQ2LG11_9PROT|nr:LptF/LptG family permease [Iodidimonas muriae]GER08559.1 hypothetical protein JCM17843_28690 [Kordiimonadales bacterium JCM 17843]GGO16575.1 hypothetical protein GCM10007972_25800 [Iodidimonas muriae]
MAPLLSRIDIYILRKAAVPLLSTVAITAALLLLERMLRLFDFVVNENGPIDIVWQMLAHLVPHYMGMAIPVGLFLGALLAFRGLSLSSELDGMMASGAGLTRLIRPIMILAVFLSIVEFGLLGYLQPYSRYEYRQLDFELRSGALGASIDVGDFVTLSDGLLLRVGGTRDGGRELLDIFLKRNVGTTEEISATAKRGAFYATDNDQTVLLRLFDGRLIDFDTDKIKPRVLSFEAQDIVINLPAVEEFRRRGGEELETTLTELHQALNGGESDPVMRARFRSSYHWRIVNILTLLVIPFVAVPLGLANKRTGAAGGLVAGLAGLIVFNELLEAGERKVAFDGASPFMALWVLLFLYAAIGAVLFATSVLRPGRGVAGAIDRIVDFVVMPLRVLVRMLKGDGT